MAYGKLKPIAPAPAPKGAYPRTITFSGPRSKRTPKSQVKKMRRA